MNSFRYLAALAGSAALMLGVSARAAVVVHTYEIEASGFSLLFGASAPLAVDPVSLNFTLSFDNGADIAATTTGLTVNAFNAPYDVKFAYWAAGDTLSIGTAPGLGGCFTPSSSFCVFIANASGLSPSSSAFSQITSAGGFWNARSSTLTVSDVPVAGVVPEPATWAMMLLGFSGLGAALRSRRRTALAA